MYGHKLCMKIRLSIFALRKIKICPLFRLNTPINRASFKNLGLRLVWNKSKVTDLKLLNILVCSKYVLKILKSFYITSMSIYDDYCDVYEKGFCQKKTSTNFILLFLLHLSIICHQFNYVG